MSRFGLPRVNKIFVSSTIKSEKKEEILRKKRERYKEKKEEENQPEYQTIQNQKKFRKEKYIDFFKNIYEERSNREYPLTRDFLEEEEKREKNK